MFAYKDKDFNGAYFRTANLAAVEYIDYLRYNNIVDTVHHNQYNNTYDICIQLEDSLKTMYLEYNGLYTLYFAKTKRNYVAQIFEEGVYIPKRYYCEIYPRDKQVSSINIKEVTREVTMYIRQQKKKAKPKQIVKHEEQYIDVLKSECNDELYDQNDDVPDDNPNVTYLHNIIPEEPKYIEELDDNDRLLHQQATQTNLAYIMKIMK